MQLLANQLPPDETGAGSALSGGASPAGDAAQPLSDEDRLAAFAPAILAALQRPAPPAGCRRAQEDPFWGTGAEAAGMTDMAGAGQAAATRLRVRVTIEQESEPAPARPTRPWTASDEEIYQASLMWECAISHWYEQD